MEAKHMIVAVADVRRDMSEASIIVVCQDETVKVLQHKLKNLVKGSRRQGSQNDLSVCVADNSRFSTAVIHKAKDHKYPRTWVVLASGLVPQISFKANDMVDRLHILRVNKLEPQRGLVIEGASTWKKTRLDAWTEKKRKRELRLSEGVYIISSSLSSNKGPGTFDEHTREESKSCLQKILAILKGDVTWENMKGPIAILAGLAGLAVGSVKAWATLTCKVDGIFLSCQYMGMKFQAAGFSFRLLAALKVIATPICIGVVAGVLVYYIPWDQFFNWLVGWLKQVFNGRLWDTIRSLWRNIQSLLFHAGSQQSSSNHGYRGMGI